MRLNELKRTQKARIIFKKDSISAQNEPKRAQMRKPINELKRAQITSNEP